jgi:predicted lipoprotein with Yx(FWY)xxD motif
MRMLRAPALMAVMGLVVAGCGSAAGGQASQPPRAPAANAARHLAGPAAANASAARAPSGASVAPSRAGSTVKVMKTEYGNVLVDRRGRALYLFTRDRTPQSQCYRECAVRWPPFLTAGLPAAGSGAQANLLGTTRRRDGSTQVTYHGHPLYYYIGDHLPGQVLCQNVEEFGGTWYVVTRRGSAVA